MNDLWSFYYNQLITIYERPFRAIRDPVWQKRHTTYTFKLGKKVLVSNFGNAATSNTGTSGGPRG